ncbi:aspartate-semialdehyde dehydrogenase [Candidatus Vecturithrix granuli]|uniref:Aspartate-semialdehyde dehydrogenase n=1 Tax=Vecturithrix granuli TaxID=1499967 RepID=A0A081C807_VECG1|nr:aspartate-semialdehyde dehydrogenase [Candidatus Vecturithrix granuli]
MNMYNVAVVGALGAVGREMTSILAERKFPVRTMKLLDIEAYEGQESLFNGTSVRVQTARAGAFTDVDIALFSAGAEASLSLAPIAVKEGAIVIDNSSAWRMDPQIPLVIPEVNPQALKTHKGLIANPNCSTIQMLVALKPIHDRYTIKRIVVSTYQAVSGSGQKAIEELHEQVKKYLDGEKISSRVYPHQIAFNALPHIDVFLENGYTKEEMKMVHETHKMLDPAIKVSATTVRIPVIRSHSEAINIETEKPFEVSEVVELLQQAPGVQVIDDVRSNAYPLALNAAGKDEVFVGRIRRDSSVDNGLNLWVVSDNLRKGAALNAVQIAETLVQQQLVHIPAN